MSLLEAVRALIQQDMPEMAWIAACDAFAAALETCADTGEIRAALRLDAAYRLPMDLSQAAYEKLIALGDYGDDVLRGYAARVLMYERSGATAFWLGEED